MLIWMNDYSIRLFDNTAKLYARPTIKSASFDQWSKNRGKKMIFGIFFLTLNPFSCLTYGKTPRTNANPDERLLDTIVWRHSKASGKTHHVLVINITSSGTYRALALHINTFFFQKVRSWSIRTGPKNFGGPVWSWRTSIFLGPLVH